jgi:hypothetical protein
MPTKNSRTRTVLPQPDFQALFFSYFGPEPRRRRYELRFGTSNVHHDLVFLSSLLHDARFRRAAVRRRGNKITIPLERDTWEVGLDLSKLHYIGSRLTIDGVESVEWRFREPIVPRVEDELWILNLSLHRAKREDDHLRFTLVGDGWEFETLLNEDTAAVLMQDVGK